MSAKSNLYRPSLTASGARGKGFTYYKLNDSTASDKLLRSLINSNKGYASARGCAQLHRHALARTHGVENDPRAGQQRCRIPLDHRIPGSDTAAQSKSSDVLPNSDIKVILTDHGTIRVDNPIKVVGDRNTNTNLRYKGR